MDDPSEFPGPGTEVLQLKILRRIEEDNASAHASFVADVLAKPSESIERTVKYTVARFDISCRWNCFLVADYQAVDLYFKPFLAEFAAQLVAEAESLAKTLDVFERQRFVKSISNHMQARKSFWTSEALKRAREFSVRKTPPSTEGDVTPSPPLMAAALAPTESTSRKTRRIIEPNLQLLDRGDTLNRKQAAEALGVSERTLDRRVADKALTPVGAVGRKRFKTKDLRRFLNQHPQDN